MGNSILDQARNYLERGFSLIPLGRNKRPVITSWLEFQERRPTKEEVEEWFGNGAANNIGIVTGKISGLTVVDLDTPEAVQFALIHNFPGTPAVKSGKGFHAYFQYREGIRNFQKRDDLPGIDLRGDGGYIMAPPSIHENGRIYSWLPNRGLDDIPLAPLPEIVLVKSPSEKTPLHELYKGVEKGSRNDTLARLCGSWARDGLTLEECREQARIWNDKNSPPLPEREIEETVKSIFTKHHREKGQGQGKESSKIISIEVGIHLTDLGNAQRFVNEHRKDLRYCFPFGKWLVWDGQRWKLDDSGEVHRRAKTTVKSIYLEAHTSSDDDLRKKLGVHALRSESDSRIKAILSLAQSEPGLPILPDDMDRDPWALNVLNGTIDLKTGILRSHRREDLITKIVPVEFQPEAECPFWIDHLNRIFAGNQGMISFVQLALGYCATGLVDERCMFICIGCGANGKSRTQEVIAEILGDYGTRSPTETLLVKREGTIPNDIARLQGIRFTFCSEAEEGRRLSESLIKELTGGDRLIGRFMRGEFFSFPATFKIWFSSNHKPIIRGTDNAIWDRIRLIPFTVTIPKCDQIPISRFMERMRPEYPGILAWLVRGCRDWVQFGLGTPQEVKEAVETYRGEMDTLGDFIEEACMLSPNARGRAIDLYEAYIKWAEKNGERAISQKYFSMRLKERGFVKSRSSSTGGRVWAGIGLQSADGADTR